VATNYWARVGAGKWWKNVKGKLGNTGPCR